jgi:hypothetical protein
MEWAENDGADYIFGLAGNAALDALVAETADNLRFHHAKSSETKLRTYASFTYLMALARAKQVISRLARSVRPSCLRGGAGHGPLCPHRISRRRIPLEISLPLPTRIPPMHTSPSVLKGEHRSLKVALRKPIGK